MRIYAWEIFERSKLWYIVFWAIILSVIAISLWYKNLWGAVILLLLLGGYLFFMLKAFVEVEMFLEGDRLFIGKKEIPFVQLKGFLLEQEIKSWTLKNIVLVFDGYAEIYTLKDTLENIELFIMDLSQLVPILETYHQSTLEKFLRKCKL